MPYHVYKILEGEDVAYVGRTVDPKRRWHDHRSSGRFAPDAVMVVIGKSSSFSRAYDMEARAIVEFRPRLNKHINCCERRANAMSTDEARKVWLETPLTVPTAEVLAAMPGWTRNMAYYRFGSRDGKNPPGHYHRRKIEGFTTARAFRTWGARGAAPRKR